MKTYTSAWMVTLLLAGIGSELHAADQQSLEQALSNWPTDTQQSIESSGAESLQQLMQEAIQLQQPQLRMRIRLSDEMPVELREHSDRNAAGNVPVSGKLPRSKIPTTRGELG